MPKYIFCKSDSITFNAFVEAQQRLGNKETGGCCNGIELEASEFLFPEKRSERLLLLSDFDLVGCGTQKIFDCCTQTENIGNLPCDGYFSIEEGVGRYLGASLFYRAIAVGYIVKFNLLMWVRSVFVRIPLDVAQHYLYLNSDYPWIGDSYQAVGACLDESDPFIESIYIARQDILEEAVARLFVTLYCQTQIGHDLGEQYKKPYFVFDKEQVSSIEYISCDYLQKGYILQEKSEFLIHRERQLRIKEIDSNLGVVTLERLPLDTYVTPDKINGSVNLVPVRF